MKIKEAFFSKNGLAVIKLAEELGCYRSGDRLPRIQDLAKQMKLSVGTTQYGLNFLKGKNIVSLVSRGHMGTFIHSVNYHALQNYMGQTVKACVMPLPYSLRYEGLAAAFYELGNVGGKVRNKGNFFLAFMNGSSRRIKALLEKRYDCALISRMAAEEHRAQGAAIEIAAAYGPRSFLENHVLVFRTRSPGSVKTLGLDKESLDQVLLSKKFLKTHPGVRVVNLTYTHIIKRLLAGDADAAVWNLDYIKEHHTALRFAPLDFSDCADAMTEAVLAVRKNDMITIDYLTRHFPAGAVLKTQEAVLKGRRIPEY
jgi:DNA-binding transcriptional regulator YhcF (GntR family)